MEIGFVSFNQEALNRANKVMKLLQGQGAVDELGLGRIRDAFSNTMFPGLSTLQTHAKYFLLMPSLYAYLEKTRIADAREARLKVREEEIAFTHRLIAGTESDNKDTKGIIGAATLRSREGFVKYDPAYVYQVGMETYGLIPKGVSIYSLLAERSLQNQNSPKKQRGNEESGDDSEDLTGKRPVFKTCGEDYSFHSKEELKISLSHNEADFLRERMIRSTPGSLLAYLLDSGLFKIAIAYRFETLEEALKDENVPKELYKTYILARRFSRFSYLLRLRYAMLYDTLVGADSAGADEARKFSEQLSKHSEEFTPNAIEEIIQFISSKVTEDTCKSFIREAAQLIYTGEYDKLDQKIIDREKEIKGIKRSKLTNAKEMQPGKPFESPQPMAFRWDTIVRTVLSEIKEGLSHE